MTHVGSEWGASTDLQKDRDPTVRTVMEWMGALVWESTVHGGLCVPDVGVGIGVCLASELFNRASGTTAYPMSTKFGSLELDWYTLPSFAFFLFPEPLLGLRSTGIMKGRGLIRDKECTKDSPFPKNKIVPVIARLPTSLRRGLEKASGANMVFIKFLGRKQYKGVAMGPALCRFVVQAVTPRREQEILVECGLSSHSPRS